MAMHMDHESFDWAHDTYVALNLDSNDAGADPASGKWTTFTDMRPSIERHGQITPPEDLSPVEPRRDSVIPQTLTSMPVARQGELPWPMEHQLQALQEFDPQQMQLHSRSKTPPERATKRRRSAKLAHTNLSQAPHNSDQQRGQTAVADPQPLKRKRGRPKSVPQPQPIEEYSKDGFLFPVSNARQSHLEKNRVAAHKCRQRRKEYIDGLEARGREASHKNKALKENVTLLREEILVLKNEVLRHAGCNFWAVDEYLARCAGDLLGMDGPLLNHRYTENATFSPLNKSEDEANVKEDREMSVTPLPSEGTSESSGNFDDLFANLDDEIEGANA